MNIPGQQSWRTASFRNWRNNSIRSQAEFGHGNILVRGIIYRVLNGSDLRDRPSVQYPPLTSERTLQLLETMACPWSQYIILSPENLYLVFIRWTRLFRFLPPRFPFFQFLFFQFLFFSILALSFPTLSFPTLPSKAYFPIIPYQCLQRGLTLCCFHVSIYTAPKHPGSSISIVAAATNIISHKWDIVDKNVTNEVNQTSLVSGPPGAIRCTTSTPYLPLCRVSATVWRSLPSHVHIVRYTRENWMCHDRRD